MIEFLNGEFLSGVYDKDFLIGVFLIVLNFSVFNWTFNIKDIRIHHYWDLDVTESLLHYYGKVRI